MWNTIKARSAFAALLVAIALFVLAALSLIGWAAAAIAKPVSQAEVLIVQHAYDGPIEQAGVLIRYQYTGGKLLVEWADTTTDGVFRSGFDNVVDSTVHN